MSGRAMTCWSLLLATGMACLGHASAAEPMSERTYRASDVFNAFLNSAEYAGIEGDCGKSLKSVLDMLGVEWPEGSSISGIDGMCRCRVVNTSANLAKIDALIDEFSVEKATIEVEVCFVEACRAALDAVGYFDTNRVDAAFLKERLMARGDARLLEAPRVVTRSGCQAVVKHVKEWIYPQDFDVTLCQNAAYGTNAPVRVLAAVEPQNFTMRETGAIVDVTPSLDSSGALIDLDVKLCLLDEPEWKDFGAKAKWEGAETYDLVMEQPFFPVRLHVDTHVQVRTGGTLVFGGVTDSRSKNADRFVFAFVTTRRVDRAGERRVPTSQGDCEPVFRRKQFKSEGMEAWTFSYLPFVPGCALREICPSSKTFEETIAEDTAYWKNRLSSVSGAEWPEGAAIHILKPLSLLWVKNTPGNLSKIAKAMEAYVCGPSSMVELDIRCISADKKALSEVGYFGTNRVSAAVLQERLMARSDAKLLEAPRVSVRSGGEALLKGVVEYIYPLDFDVMSTVSEQAIGTNIVMYGSDSAGMAVEPQNFTMREVGAIVHATARQDGTDDMVKLELDTQFMGEPEWKDFGAKAKWKGAATYDLTMEQPLFPVMVSEPLNGAALRLGETCVFGGGADRRKGEEGRFILVFLTPRLL